MPKDKPREEEYSPPQPNELLEALISCSTAYELCKGYISTGKLDGDKFIYLCRALIDTRASLECNPSPSKDPFETRIEECEVLQSRKENPHAKS